MAEDSPETPSTPPTPSGGGKLLAGKFIKAITQVKTLNKLSDSGGYDDAPTIKVCVRVRPFITEEITGERSGGKTECCISMPTKTTVQMLCREPVRSFEFDRCYWSHDKDHPLYATQQTLQEELGENMLDHAMNGFNNCIFAYGQTGSGKSYSVLGGKGEERGLLPRVVQGLFEHFKDLGPGTVCKTLVAYIEIYNEQIKDLLAEKNEDDMGKDEKAKKLEVKQHPVLGMIIPGLTESAVRGSEDVLRLVDYGAQMRHVGSTAMNAASSRSHCIFTFKTSVSDNGGNAKMSQTHLVDLAGSERAGRTKATGDRLQEAAAINKSLSNLARVISELAKGKKRNNPPFRDSKLTYILKESLCGNSKTIMMAAISPSAVDYDETLSTMKFAQSVKLVQTNAVQNKVNEKSIEEQLRKELDSLRTKLQQYETEKSDDARRLSNMQRKYQDCMQLVSVYGDDWDDLLEAEKTRMKKRTAILNLSDSDIQKLSELNAVSSDSDDESSDNESWSSYSTVASRTTKQAVTLIQLDAAMEKNASLVRSRSSLVLTGPVARTARPNVAEGQASELGDQLARLRNLCSQAQETIAKLAMPGIPQVQLRAVAMLDPIDPFMEFAVCVTKSSPKGEAGIPTWILESELNNRLQKLQRLAGNPSNKAAFRDPWAKVSGTPENDAQRAGLNSSALEAPDMETAALRAEVSTAKAELARMKSKLAQSMHMMPSRSSIVQYGGPEKDVMSSMAGLSTQDKARTIAGAIKGSFESAIRAVDAAQDALERSDFKVVKKQTGQRRSGLV